MDEHAFNHQLDRRQLIAADCLVATAYTVLLGLMVFAGHGTAGWTWLLAAGIGLPVAVRRIRPVLVFGVVLALSVLAVLLDLMRDPFLAASYTLYVVALTRRPERGRPLTSDRLLGTAGMVGAALVFLAAIGGAPAGTAGSAGRGGITLTGVAGLCVAWILGTAVRDRRAAAARAARQLAQRAVSDERLRIARELHDIVAHSMGLIAVKAGVANHVLHVRPEEVADALAVIETTSRDALVELRHMLGLLRTSADPCPDGLIPPGGMTALPELAARMETMGVRVQLEVRGPDGLPEGVELAVYRIVQESLTNVAKHAGATTCRVLVESDAHEVLIRVTDSGGTTPAVTTTSTTTSTTAAGHGLIGIRERVTMYGGAFAAGPRPDGGFEVSARLPYQPARVTA